jgi:multisubunit Na+/H+ antiporter MnhB subunit
LRRCRLPCGLLFCALSGRKVWVHTTRARRIRGTILFLLLLILLLMLLLLLLLLRAPGLARVWLRAGLGVHIWRDRRFPHGRLPRLAPRALLLLALLLAVTLALIVIAAPGRRLAAGRALRQALKGLADPHKHRSGACNLWKKRKKKKKS